MQHDRRWRLLLAWALVICLPGVGLAGSPWIDLDLDPEQVLGRLRADDPPLLLDVRSPAEYEGAHIPGALNIPHTELAGRIDEIRSHSGRDIVVFCESGRRAGLAAEVLREAGIERIHHLAGDMRAWRQAGRPVVGGRDPG